MHTDAQYQAVTERCRRLFLQKAADYGTAWRVLRPVSVTDQLYIKARRIRTLEDGAENRVGESIEGEWIGLVNYSLIGLMVLELAEHGGPNWEGELPLAELERLYDTALARCRDTQQRKNHDYGEAWRDMRPTSFTDLILMKLLRVKQLEANGGPSVVSEGVDANYIDILNYAVFALIKLDEQTLHTQPTQNEGA